MKWLFPILILASCATQPPKTHTPAPALGGSIHGVADAKEMISRAQLSNDEISKLIRELKGLQK